MSQIQKSWRSTLENAKVVMSLMITCNIMLAVGHFMSPNYEGRQTDGPTMYERRFYFLHTEVYKKCQK